MFKLLTSIGIVATFLVGTIIGIQFMIASAEDKAKVKEALVPYVIGCAVIFGAFTIWSITVNIGQDILDSSTGSTGSTGPTGPTGPTLPYEKEEVIEYRCLNCNGRLLSEREIVIQKCNSCGEYNVEHKKYIKYVCATCGDEWDEGEKRQQACDNCYLNKK